MGKMSGVPKVKESSPWAKLSKSKEKALDKIAKTGMTKGKAKMFDYKK